MTHTPYTVYTHTARVSAHRTQAAALRVARRIARVEPATVVYRDDGVTPDGIIITTVYPREQASSSGFASASRF